MLKKNYWMFRGSVLKAKQKSLPYLLEVYATFCDQILAKYLGIAAHMRYKLGLDFADYLHARRLNLAFGVTPTNIRLKFRS